jgi:membrane fusion protein (multidrug efflux system)
MLSRNYISLCFCAALLSINTFAQLPKAEKPLEVIVQTAKKRELQNNIEALGSLRANESAVLTAKSTKTITRINFEDGQRVAKGTLLVQMTNAEEAALLEEAHLKAEEARRQWKRTEVLAKTGAVSVSMLDERKRLYETARAHAQALDSRLKDLIITAPFDGVVGIRSISVGSLISPGDVIASIHDDSKMKLDFTLPATYLRSLRKGVPIEASSEDLGGKIFKSTIFSIDNQVDEVTRSIKARAILQNPQHQFKPGMLMNVVVQADSRQALVISESSLVPMGSNNFVFVVRQGKDAPNGLIAERRQITIGQRYKGLVEVIDGLAENEKVVTHGLQKIHAGQPLSIMAEQSNDPAIKPEPLAELLQQKKREGR